MDATADYVRSSALLRPLQAVASGLRHSRSGDKDLSAALIRRTIGQDCHVNHLKGRLSFVLLVQRAVTISVMASFDSIMRIPLQIIPYPFLAAHGTALLVRN